MYSLGISTNRGTINASAYHVIHTRKLIFNVRFKNGYENIFYADVENGQWIEEDLGYTLLAAKVGEQIIQRLNYPVHVPKILTWQQIEPGISDKKFGYYQFRQGRDTLLEIYDQNKKYLYTLAEADADEWQILLGNFNALKGINLQFLERITASLNLNDF